MTGSSQGPAPSEHVHGPILKGTVIAIVVLFAAAGFASIAADTSSAEQQGTIGEGITWSFDGNHTLTITGSGEIPDYGTTRPPWETYKDQIYTVTLGEGITKVGDYTFQYYSSITELNIPSTLTVINRQAFEGCSSLQAVDLIEGITYIGPGAFYGCSSLPEVVIPSTLYSIFAGTFQNCTSMLRVTIPKTIGDISPISPFSGTLYGPYEEYLDPTPFNLGGHVFSGEDYHYLYMCKSGFTLNCNGGSSVYSYVFGIPGDPAEVRDPDKVGYVFGGWYSDESLQTPYYVTTFPDSEVVLYAKWNPIPPPPVNDGEGSDDSGNDNLVIGITAAIIVLAAGMVVAFARK